MDSGQRTDIAEPFLPNLTDGLESTPEKKKGASKNVKAAIAGITLALMVVTGVGCNAKAPEKPIPTKTEAPANPGSSATTSVEAATTTTPEKSSAEGIPTVESLEVDASLLDNPEALMKTFAGERVEEWFNAGATLENAKAALKSNVSMVDYATKIATEYDTVFIEALMVKGWESDPALVEWVKDVTTAHLATLALNFLTSFPKIHPLDKVPYERTTDIKEVVSATRQADGSLDVVVIQTDNDNSDLNRVGEGLTDGVRIEGNEAKPTFKFVNEDSKVKMSGIIFSQSPAE